MTANQVYDLYYDGKVKFVSWWMGVVGGWGGGRVQVITLKNNGATEQMD